MAEQPSLHARGGVCACVEVELGWCSCIFPLTFENGHTLKAPLSCSDIVQHTGHVILKPISHFCFYFFEEESAA